MADDEGTGDVPTGSGMGELAFAMQMRDIIRELISIEIDALRPEPTYAKVSSIDLATKTCMVIITGDTVAIKANYGSIAPSAVDQLVRIEGPPGDRYIADVLGETQDNKTVAWTNLPSLAANVALNIFDPAKYRVIIQNGSKVVQLRGRLDLTGTAITTLWTMPTDARPVVQLGAIPVGRNLDGGAIVAHLTAQQNGIMLLTGGTTGANSGNTGSGGNVATSANEVPGSTVARDTNHKHITTDGPAPTASTWTSFIIGNQTWSAQAISHSHTFTGTSHSHTGGVHTHTVPAPVFPTWLNLNGVQYVI